MGEEEKGSSLFHLQTLGVTRGWTQEENRGPGTVGGAPTEPSKHCMRKGTLASSYLPKIKWHCLLPQFHYNSVPNDSH